VWRTAHQLALSPDTVLERDDEPVATVMHDGSIVVLSIRAGSYFDFNRVGGEIWNMLAEPKCVADVLDALAKNYDIGRDAMARDVLAFLQALIDARLIRTLTSKEKIR
jgi:hypothetical protein